MSELKTDGYIDRKMLLDRVNKLYADGRIPPEIFGIIISIVGYEPSVDISEVGVKRDVERH